MKSIVKKSGSRTFVLMLGGACLFVGCGSDEPTAEDGVDAEEGVTVDSTQQAVYAGWTPWTSEEFPPVVCDSGSLISAFQCGGSYCDNIRVYCEPAGGTLGDVYWTTYFSEEGEGSRVCASGYWTTGMACSGRYCDNISLQCSQMTNLGADGVHCYSTGRISEEGGGYLGFGNGYYMRGAQCSGSYCDNMSFHACQK